MAPHFIKAIRFPFPINQNSLPAVLLIEASTVFLMVQKKLLTYKGHIVFEKLTSPTIHRIPKLYEGNEACFMFINKGAFYVRTTQEYIQFEEGQALLAKCVDYFIETTPVQREKHGLLEMIGVLLVPEVVEELFQFEVAPTPYKIDYCAKQLTINKLLHNFKTSIDLLLENPELADEAMIKNKLIEFILLLSKTENAPSHLDFLSALFQPFTHDFKATIQNNFFSSLSVEELAHLCSMSVSSFKRKFQEVFQDSPHRYLTQKKLEKAFQLITQSERRITDIAFDCGFESISTFNRAFKKAYRQSPSHFRMSQNA